MKSFPIENMDQEESMIKIRNACVYDLDDSIRASKFPMSTEPDKLTPSLTKTAVALAQSQSGHGHDNYLQGIRVAFDMNITVKTMVDAERYHFLDIVSCTSTMHKIVSFDINKAYCKYVDTRMIAIMVELVDEYNQIPDEDTERRKEQYLRILYSNPCGFTYTARFTTNYRQLKTIYIQRKDHRLPEWRELCKWIESLPHSELIIGNKEDNEA